MRSATFSPNGRQLNPRLVRNRNSVRWSINNFHLAHIRNLGLMAMALDPAADPSGTMARHIRNIEGQWMYQVDRMLSGDGFRDAFE